MRRKKIKTSLAPLFSHAELAKLGIDSNLRPEQIKIKDFLILADDYLRRKDITNFAVHGD